jgi:hypothetical protein
MPTDDRPTDDHLPNPDYHMRRVGTVVDCLANAGPQSHFLVVVMNRDEEGNDVDITCLWSDHIAVPYLLDEIDRQFASYRAQLYESTDDGGDDESGGEEYE